MSARFGVAQAEELFEGIVTAAKRYGAEVRFFDFVSSVTGMTISCTAWGSREGKVKFAPATDINDIICVTGDVGAAYLGLQVLERERRIFESGAAVQPDLSDFRYVIGRQLRPDLKTDRLEELYKAGVLCSAMTVIREGLASELLGLCRGKEVGCRLYYDRIPVDSDTSRNAEEMNIDPVVAALNGGEDYEFLFYAPLTQADILNRQDGVSIIGYITDQSEGCNLVTPDDHMVELRAQGWNKS
jgi:thiamine-monophosphate kinase